MAKTPWAAERLAALHAEIRTMFADGADGRKMTRHMARGVDALLVELWRETGDVESGVDIVAVGGYGRGELCPYSDWDLWFLLPKSGADAAGRHVERFLYALWDLRVKVGHAVWTVDEAMAHLKEDRDAATAMLESRLLTGGGVQFERLQSRFGRMGKRWRRQFLKAKIEELMRRRRCAGDTASLMEPDIKEGKGGLRDVQALYWMSRAWHGVGSVAGLVERGILTPRESGQLERAYHFLLRLRCGLHIEAGRASERLGFEQQASMAAAMGVHDLPHRPAVESLMKRYFGHAGRVATIADMLIRHFKVQLLPRRFLFRRDIGDGLVLEGRWIDVRDERIFEDEPLRLLGIFRAAQQDKRRISTHALRLIREHAALIDSAFRSRPEANALFMDILKQPRNVAWALKEMSDTGVLGRFIPAFGRIVGLGQFNRYHTYTVDTHTVRAIAEARNLRLGRPGCESFPLACEAIAKIMRPELLYIALLFHDIAKGRSGDHSEIGAGLALRFCHKLGLSSDAADLVRWLVAHHLEMAMTSQRCDLSDRAVIRAFATRVGDIERLRFLLVLTVADIRAVGPNVWNEWKGSLLSDLYRATERELMGAEEPDETLEQRIHLRVESTLAKCTPGERPQARQILASLPWRPVMHFRSTQLVDVVRILMRAGDGHAVDIQTDTGRGETRILVLAGNREGLFADLTAAIAAGHIGIVAAHAFALKDGRVLDVFHVQDAGRRPLEIEGDIQRLRQRIEDVLAGRRMRTPTPAVKPSVLMRRQPVSVRELPLASTRQTAIEVVAADRPGLLAAFARTIAEVGVDIRGASVSTFGEKVVDVFFLADRQGHPLQPEKITRVCKELRMVAVLPEEQ